MDPYVLLPATCSRVHRRAVQHGGDICVISGTSPPEVRKRLFHQEPCEFTADSPARLLAAALGATLYSPATRPAARRRHRQAGRARRGVDGAVPGGLHRRRGRRGRRGEPRPAVRRPRRGATRRRTCRCCSSGSAHPSRSPTWCGGSGPPSGSCPDSCFPKFTEERGIPFLEALADAPRRRADGGCSPCRSWSRPSCCTGRRRVETLEGIARTVDKYRDRVLALRLGVTDFCSAYGLRRAPDMTAYDVQIVASVIADVVNVLGRADGTGFTVTGPVWEYFRLQERMFKPQLRRSPFLEGQAEELRDGADRARPWTGCCARSSSTAPTACWARPASTPPMCRRCTRCPSSATRSSATRQDILRPERGGGGVLRSAYTNKMNEVKPHRAWAERTLLRAEVFGVAQRGRRLRGAARRRPARLTSRDTDKGRMNDAVTTRTTGLVGDLGRRAARRRARAATTDAAGPAGAGPAPQPQAGASAGLATCSASTCRSRPRVVYGARATRSAAGCGSCSATRRRPRRSSSATPRPPPASATRVADGLGLAPYLHSTRRPVAGVAPAGGFEEAHSHATSHLLLPEDPALLAGDGPLVLVDDEFSTGNTVLNTIRRPARALPARRGTWSSPWSTCARRPTAGRLDDFAARARRPRRPGRRWPPARYACPRGSWRRARTGRRTRLPRQAVTRRRRGRRAVPVARAPSPDSAPRRGRRTARTRRRPPAAAAPRPPSASTWTGPRASRTAGGTASPRRTATGWRPPCPRMAARLAEALPAGRRAASSSSASRS